MKTPILVAISLIISFLTSCKKDPARGPAKLTSLRFSVGTLKKRNDSLSDFISDLKKSIVNKSELDFIVKQLSVGNVFQNIAFYSLMLCVVCVIIVQIQTKASFKKCRNISGQVTSDCTES